MMEIRPEIPVILCTGHSEKIDAEKAEKLGIAAYMAKPFVMEEIARTLREVLDKK